MLASKPIAVRLTSDQLTTVTLYRVGDLGAFASKEVELRPGTYTVIGSRDGYRDVRQTFTVGRVELAADQRGLRRTDFDRVGSDTE